MEGFEFLTQRPVVTTLAVIGAVLVMLGANTVAPRLGLGPNAAQWLRRCGYGVMWGSITLFIVAGFVL